MYIYMISWLYSFSLIQLMKSCELKSFASYRNKKSDPFKSFQILTFEGLQSWTIHWSKLRTLKQFEKGTDE